MKKLSKLKGLSDELVEVRYSNWLKMIIDLIKPTNLFLVGGRGTAKTTDILAERIIDIVEDMPRAPIGLVSDTYVNLQSNILPNLVEGWNRKKFYEGVHYVVGIEPPDHWPKPYRSKTFVYKHVISFYTGVKMFLLSLDRSSINAGISVVHHLGDEVKYFKEEKTNKLFPTLRGDRQLYANSHYFMGQTFTTDMPDPNIGEHDWILKQFKRMDKTRILKILQTALEVNEILIELAKIFNALYPDEEFYLEDIQKHIKQYKNRQLSLKYKLFERWGERLRKVREGSTLFLIISSFVNADILTLKYFINNIETLDIEEVKTSIFSLRPGLRKGERFYGKLRPSHFYKDGYDYKYYDQFSLTDNINQISKGLRYIDSNRPLEAGFDAGNMMSLAIGQPSNDKKIYRIVKDMYVLSPNWVDALAALFVAFFIEHKNKRLKLYHDRATNQYRKQKQDIATKLKNAIEKDKQGRSTGWNVDLMNVGQGNISHQQDYELINLMLDETDLSLPQLQIDYNECKHVKAALENTPIKKNITSKAIEKEKKSEKLPIHRLPLESTNMSDAVKYLLCRPAWLKHIKVRPKTQMGNISVRSLN